MNCIRRANAWVLHYSALHFAKEYVATVETTKALVERDLRDSGLSIDDLKHNAVLLDFRGEGQCDKLIINMIAYLRSIPVKNVAVIFSTEVDTSKLNYPALSLVDSLADHCQWFTRLKQQSHLWETKCDFLCLMRRPSTARAKLARRLLSEFKNLRISFGAMCQPMELVDYRSWFPDHTLPLLLDGMIPRNKDFLEHDAINPLFRTCAVNIIAESSAQADPMSWNSILVTEKTFKAFGMLQLPVWWAVPGVVNCTRNMGFDLFDDIIDHSYDNEQDEDLRLEVVIKELKKLEKLNLAQLRTDLKPRLIRNWERLDDIVQSQSDQFTSILKVLNLDTPI